jgi:hypothetical protein
VKGAGNQSGLGGQHWWSSCVPEWSRGTEWRKQGKKKNPNILHVIQPFSNGMLMIKSVNFSRFKTYLSKE